MYDIQFGPAAFRIFKKLPKDVRNILLSKILSIQKNPLLGEPLKGSYRFFRSVHVGFKGTKYRIIYQVFTQTSTIIIRLANKRENIYSRLEQLGN